MTDGKINKNGILFVGRPGVMVPAQCVFDSTRTCDHFCVAFREPRVFTPENISIDLCKPVGTLFFESFEDDRTDSVPCRKLSVAEVGGGGNDP
jgi:hypothetical protein